MRQFPTTCRGEQLQSNSIQFAIERLAVDHPRSRFEISQKRSDVQAFVGLPRPAGQHPCAAGADVFRDALLRGCSQIQARQIDSYFQGSAAFPPLRCGFHRRQPNALSKPVFAKKQTERRGGEQRRRNHTPAARTLVKIPQHKRSTLAGERCPAMRQRHPMIEQSKTASSHRVLHKPLSLSYFCVSGRRSGNCECLRKACLCFSLAAQEIQCQEAL
jgi:hypothetical protein